MNKVFFSILMCVYNKTEFLEKAIHSVLQQQEPSWELLILDNSDSNREETWAILTKYSCKDKRIRIFRNDGNVSWAKGASILLAKACGVYMTFLAADDFLFPGALEKVKKEAMLQDADVLWVGNAYYESKQERLCELGRSVPSAREEIKERSAKNIRHIMERVFYNSFFHYVRVEFLKKEGIDFYDHGYGDCAGMTEVLCRAGKMAVLDETIYGLIVNTSQSRMTFGWEGIEYVFPEQWKSIRQACMRDAYFSFQDMRYCAIAILRTEIGGMNSLAEGAECVNRLMNPVAVDFHQRLQQIKKILENEMIQEMAQFMGRFDYEQEILSVLEKLFRFCPQEEREALLYGQGWLGTLLEAGYCLGAQGLQKKQRLGEEELRAYRQALAAPQNCGMFGMGLFLQGTADMQEEVFLKCRDYLQEILAVYHEWKSAFSERIWNGLGRGGRLKGNGKVELAAFCKYILEQ